MEPLILASARKHGITDNDMLHAIRKFIRELSLDDLVMFIGPDSSWNLIEVGVVRANHEVRIVHAMPARSKFLEIQRA